MNKIEDIQHINCAEAILGDIYFRNRNAILPVYNLHIIGGSNNPYLRTIGENYIEKSYILLEGISNIVWEYEKKNSFDPDKTECFGGVHFETGDYIEFWVEYNKGVLLLTNESHVQIEPYSQYKSSSFENDFFLLNPWKSS